mmetsp:Transcript_6105/g.7020  ORF Transcript_6105/g.7020 Transcript_6105/m.7020 type:complete len:96 (+) Transcript_6105:533-820(+)|eukprot:CAMPEP_0184053106 /NCGR_PEP_ID=MMETSP0956-20121227/5744_1 /TAXON_ID=627963 /ORGANISM="Aplanochytrium sp, Strain PBS07" /LENGTH=95 /DNA_ID=CAMNT_0026346397 /DNA_START=488 /DNA_END=775 /DNA_ORIENTATION=+
MSEPQGFEKLKAKMLAEPLVPAGALLTTAILCGAFYNFRRGNKKMTNYMMRGRVAAQGATMGFVAYGAYFTALDRKEYDDSGYVGNLGHSSPAQK